ncbi:MAG: hypothetical protein MI754_16445, partial [Chromatiales bacterium]|nr:hypothetical protein [Chromatiales bacterium]
PRALIGAFLGSTVTIKLVLTGLSGISQSFTNKNEGLGNDFSRFGIFCITVANCLLNLFKIKFHLGN